MAAATPADAVAQTADRPERIEAEQLALLCGQWERTQLPVAIVAASVIYVVWPYASAGLAIGWGALTVGVLLVRQQLCRRLFGSGAIHANPRLWRRVLGATGLLTGSLGGAASYLFLPVLPPLEQALVTAILAGWGAGAIGANGPYPPAYYAFAVGFFAPAAIVWVAVATAHGAVVGALLAYMAVVMMLFARGLGETAKRSIRIRFENEALVTLLRTANETLDAARGRAEEANRSKSRFLAAAVHDLGQPLHALHLLIAVLDLRAREPAQRDLANKMTRAVQSLDNLLAELVELSRLDAGVVTPAPAVVRVPDLIEHLAPEYRAKAAEKGLAFAVHDGDDAIVTDRTLFERALRNLLENAIRYTERGEVSVACRRAGDEVAITVADTGIGIPAAEQARIFDEFYQIANPARDRREGLGLGLAIVQRLVQRLGHRVTVESEPGRGSRFTLYAARGAPEAAGAGTAAPPPAASGREVAGARLLVIDDDADVLHVLRLLLEEWGCEVLAAGSLAEAQVQLRESGLAPDVLLVDFRLGGRDTGVAAIAALRAVLGPVPAILVTAETGVESLHEVAAAGHPVLQKPVNPEDLLATIAHCLAEKPAFAG